MNNLDQFQTIGQIKALTEEIELKTIIDELKEYGI